MKYILLIILAVLANGCEFLESGVQSLEQVEAFIGVTLPEQARGVEYDVMGFTDTLIRLRFEANPEAAQAFVKSLNIPLEPGGDRSDGAPNDPPWWQPETAERYATGEYDLWDANRHYQAIVDQTQPDRWIVYLLAYST